MKPRQPVFRKPSRQRGAVIVLVLVTLLLASFLLTAFIRRSGTELLADARAHLGRELRAEAYSALESALAVVAAQRALDGELHRIDPGWTDALARSGYEPLAGREVAVEFEDETGRISLPLAEVGVLRVALTGAGLDQSRGEQMAHTLRDWMRPGDADASSQPDAPDYHRHEPAYRPARRPLLAWSELAAVEMDRRLFFDEDGNATGVSRALMRDFSLHAFSRSNLNTASPTVLAAMGFGLAEVRAVEARRTAGHPQDAIWRSSEEAAQALGAGNLPPMTGTQVELLRVTIAVHQGSVHYRLAVVVRLTSSGQPAASAAPAERKRVDYPFAVLEIQENLEPAESLSP